MRKKMEISKDLKHKYDSQYSDKTENWRKLGAKGKASNIISVSKGQNYSNIIEIGAGDGNILEQLSLQKFAKTYTAVEISTSAIEQIKTKNIQNLISVTQFDGYKLPFSDNEFELAICSHVIEHVEHPRILLREIKRISKSQIFEIPIDFSVNVDKKTKHFLSYGHINIFTPSLFNFLLLSEDFKIIKSKYTLYDTKIISFQHGVYSLQTALFLVKKLIWKTIPILKKIKPNTYTVLTN
jgi:ubiquinone/menaquinone biosynthesis C-methylase UbiE